MTHIVGAPAPKAPEMVFSYFDRIHWYRVRTERIRQGITRVTEVGEAVEHPLVGKTVTNISTGATLIVESVKKDWCKGWFLRALLSSNGSHAVCFIENISCTDLGIQAEIERFSKNYRLVPIAV